MSTMPLQEKIAQLEMRIAALEKWRQEHSHVSYVRRVHTEHAAEGIFGESWRKMWEHFHEVMKKL
jgi:hypothetical protein